MTRNPFKQFVDGVASLHEAFRYDVATGLQQYITSPELWGCLEDGVYAMQLYFELERNGLSMMKREYCPVHNPEIFHTALVSYLRTEAFKAEVGVCI